MNDFWVGQEEPFFYIGLLLVFGYFTYLMTMDFIRKSERKKTLQLIQSDITRMENHFQYSRQRLKTVLVKYYSSEWIDAALNGRVFANMPVILLKLALGTPDSVMINGMDKEVWHYREAENASLIVNVWNGKVISWK